MSLKLKAERDAPGLFDLKSMLTMSAISIAYLLLSWVLIGFKPTQVILVVITNLLYFLSAPTRELVKGFSIFIIYWVIFDYMKAFPNYRYNEVHIESLYRHEKDLFGIVVNGVRLTANEYWLLHRSLFLDIAAGLFYLMWIPVPLGFSAWLFFRSRPQFYGFALTFLLVNLIGFVIYYLYPAAPPWYIQLHGTELDVLTKGNTAGLGRFDRFFHAGIFSSLYEQSSNVFAAMPSLHASYPVIVLYYGLRNRLGKVNIAFAVIMAGIWFAAVYSSHHYILDVLAGILCAVVGIGLFQLLFRKRFPLTGTAKVNVRLNAQDRTE